MRSAFGCFFRITALAFRRKASTAFSTCFNALINATKEPALVLPLSGKRPHAWAGRSAFTLNRKKAAASGWTSLAPPMIPPGRNFTVLYVEDEENDIILLQHAWREASIGQRLEIAKNGKEALEYFRTHPKSDICGLALLDLNLPLLSGFDVLCWLRKHEQLKRLPVIVLTSSNQDHDIQLAYELGANAF